MGVAAEDVELRMSQEDSQSLDPMRPSRRWKRERKKTQPGTTEIKIPARAQQKRKEDLAKNPNVKVGGDLSVLQRKDDFYSIVALVSGILTFGSFIGSMYVIGDIIHPAAMSLKLVERTCTVRSVSVVDRLNVPLPDSGMYIDFDGNEQDRDTGALRCWRSCDEEGETCTWSRGYGFCEHAARSLSSCPVHPIAIVPVAGVQLNVTFPLDETVSAASLVPPPEVVGNMSSPPTSPPSSPPAPPSPPCNYSIITDCAALLVPPPPSPPPLPPPLPPPPAGPPSPPLPGAPPGPPPPLAPPPPVGMVGVTTNISVGVMLEHLDHARAWDTAASTAAVEGAEVQFDPRYWPGFLHKTEELYDIPALSSLLCAPCSRARECTHVARTCSGRLALTTIARPDLAAQPYVL
jgi:hypothetical protein